MDRKNQLVERRQFERFPIQDGAIATLKTGRFIKFGIINCFSMGGLAFKYVISPEESALFQKVSEEAENSDPAKLDILFDIYGFHLPKIPCSIVADETITPKNVPDPETMMHCRIQFGDLNPDQKKQIDCFIRTHQKI